MTSDMKAVDLWCPMRGKSGLTLLPRKYPLISTSPVLLVVFGERLYGLYLIVLAGGACLKLD
jgi:hypothetical protein